MKMVRHSVLRGLYDVEKTIGCGGFAKVKLATHIATGEKVAIKILCKDGLGEDLPRVQLELKALKSFSHKHICKLYQVIETATHYFLVIEYCSGGELFDHIVEKNRLSESESRNFFRQIVSAVAYLHKLGYAHRDVKPENVLLDKDQNLKLIDFGLCAKPKGGMASPLFTSCGSPTYAAPELVLGRQYLGPEIDVWALGVLLYALLAGVLPFDDLNIDSLYKKILNGRYQEPSCMSQESKQLIKSMLQVDPKKRITVTELMSHSWLTLGILEPVSASSEHSKTCDRDCVKVMAECFHTTSEIMWKHLSQWKYDYYTATYYLLMSKKKRGSPLKLRPISAPFLVDIKLEGASDIQKPRPRPLIMVQCNDEEIKPRTPYFDCRSGHKNVNASITTLPQAAPFPNPSEFVEPLRPAVVRNPQKRIRSPIADEFSPVPSKKSSSGKSTPKTPERKNIPSSSSGTPGSARRVLDSIERSLHKVRHVLTPRKLESENATQPVVLSNKNLCNVSTTQCNDPEYVITELFKAFQQKGFHCNRKGFILRGNVEANVLHHCNGCSFELEICYLPCMGEAMVSQKSQNSNDTPTRSILKNGPLNNLNNTPTGDNAAYNSTPTSIQLKKKSINQVAKSNKSFAFVGIKRKRLKGDSWCYKKVCEEILAVTVKKVKDFKGTESTV